MENLSKIREISGISPKVMSKLLNVTVYTYNAFEKGNMTPSPEIIKMISMIYEVDEALLTDDSLQLDQETENRLMAISALPENERYIHLYSHILEKGQVPNYRNIKRVKERIREMLDNKYVQHLLLSIEKNMETVRQQMGKTDIEPPDYEKKISTWHTDLLEKICEKNPEYYVRSVNIYENGLLDINHIEYVYFEDDKKISLTSVNLFDIDEDTQKS